MSTMRLSLRTIAERIGGVLHGSGDALVEHLSIDSRDRSPAEGTLFVALRGERHDGHDHIAALLGRGVRLYLVQVLPPVEVRGSAQFIVVPDTLIAFQRTAAMHRAAFKLPVIGITGSNGKTIVKEWLYQLLRGEEHIVRSPGSWNSQVGVPLSVWGIGPSHTLGIFEAGISTRGEMERLAPIIAPTVGVLTTIGPAHGEGFSDDAEKTHEKWALFRDAEAVICCTDQDVVKDIVRDRPPRLLRDWSRTRAAYVRVQEEQTLDAATRISIIHDGSATRFVVPFTDRASVDNAITCITVLFHLGRSAAWIAERVAVLSPVEMRLRTMQGVQGCTIIDDTYSNDLASLQIALEHQFRIAHGRKRVVVVGDIAESALAATELYSEVGKSLAQAAVDRLIGIGPGMVANKAALPRGTECYLDTAELIASEDTTALAGSVVLVKGARQLHMEAIVQRWQQQVHGTELQVDLDAVRHNLNHYRALLRPNVKVMAMVKAFGYGSGAIELARLFAHDRVDQLGVAYADEGIELRQHGIELPIVVMNPEPVPLETLHRFRLETEVYDMSSLQAAIDHARTVPDALAVHIKLDTGMHRLGFTTEELPALLDVLRGAPVRVGSILSHLAASEDPAHDGFTRSQLDRFTDMASRIGEVLGHRPLWHIANSGAVSRFPEAQFDMVRLGIGLHGIGASEAESQRLLPTVTLRTVVAQVKDIPVGDSIGYGRSYVASAPMRIAVLPLGYADGFLRRLGNGTGRVWIGGSEARTVGRICMDMCMVDVTGIPCRPGDEVVVFGKEHTLAHYAADLDTIPYEALTSIAQRVKRVYTRG